MGLFIMLPKMRSVAGTSMNSTFCVKERKSSHQLQKREVVGQTNGTR
jgi:hypothetical protein